MAKNPLDGTIRMTAYYNYTTHREFILWKDDPDMLFVALNACLYKPRYFQKLPTEDRSNKHNSAIESKTN